MKNTLIVALCLCFAAGLVLLLCGCRKTEPKPEPAETEPVPDDGTSVILVNELTEADFWILPRTEENLKTTTWGKATAADLGENASVRLSLAALGGPGTYIFRAITPKGMYFSADGVELKDGYVLTLKKNGEIAEWVLEVADADGEPVGTYEVFGARL